MTVHAMTTLPAAADCAPVRCLFAIELSGSSWVVAALTPLSDKISRYKLAAHDAPGVLDIMARLRQRCEAALGCPVEIVCCYEASYDGFWLHRVLEAQDVRNHVIDPASLQVNRRARQVKTDRIDAEKLVRALAAHLRGEPKVVSVVRVPSPAEEDARRPHRERDRLIGERVQHVNRIKGLLAGQGLYDFEPLRRDRWQRLEELMTGDGRALPERLRAEIGRELKRLELVLAMVAELEAARDAVLKEATPAHPQAGTIKALAKLKAIGPEFATKLAGEVFYRSFTNRRELAGYVGLAPSPFASGERSRDQGISKAGNARARTSLIELAWMWLRHQPDSALSQWFRERVGERKGRCRRIAVVALARKLLVALWRYVETGLIPSGAVLKG
jgi:transposase